MHKHLLIALSLTVAVSTDGTAKDAKAVLEATIKNMGDVKSVQYTGSGAVFTLGQSVTAGAPWPRVEVKSFTRTVDYEKLATRIEGVGPQGPTPTQFVMGDKAWGQTGSNVIPAAPAVVADRQLQIWLTPHGFLKGALANKATAKGGKITTVSFMTGKQRIVGTISADHQVEKVESWIDNPVLGDMHVETNYSDYRDFGRFRFPAKMVQKQGGFPVFELTVNEAKANVPLDVTVPDSVRQAAPPSVRVATEKLADGIWYLTGGSHHSVLAEFGDHVTLIEAPLNEERSTAVIAEVRKLVPTKPIRYLVNTHHHFDHSGGLRTCVAQGATVVTHKSNQTFYQQTLKAPRKLNPDLQARTKKTPKFILVDAKHVLSDGTRTVEIHHIQGNPHNSGILMAWFPKEKLLAEVDVYTPLAPNASPPATPNPATVNLYENIQRLNLDVTQIAPLHGRVVEIAELRKTIGK